MEITRADSEGAEVRLSRTEVTAITNLLQGTENWPFEAVGPREFVRALHRAFLDLAEEMTTT